MRSAIVSGTDLLRDAAGASQSDSGVTVDQILGRLEAINGCLADNSNALLGIKDLRTIHALIELCVVRGIYPSLDAGMGLPTRMPSAYLANLRSDKSNIQPISADTLSTLMERLERMINLGTHLSSILLDRYLPDIIAGIGQLHGNFDQIEKQVKAEDLMRAWMAQLNPETPVWWRSRVTSVLAEMPLRPHGLRATLNFIIGDTNPASVVVQRVDKAVQLITSVPARTSAGEYIAKIASQLIDLLALPSDQVVLRRASVQIVVRLYQRNPDDVRTFIFTPGILLHLQNPSDETRIAQTLSKLSLFLVYPDTPSAMISDLVLDVIPILWRIAEFAQSSNRFGVKSQILDILVSWIKMGAGAEGVMRILQEASRSLLEPGTLLPVSGAQGGVATIIESTRETDLLQRMEVSKVVVLDLMDRISDQSDLLLQVLTALLESWMAYSDEDNIIQILLITHSLQHTLETHQAKLKEDPRSMLRIIQSILRSYLEKHTVGLGATSSGLLHIVKDESVQDSTDSEIDDALITALLSLLSAMLSEVESPSQLEGKAEFIGLLQRLRDISANVTIKSTAMNIEILLDANSTEGNSLPAAKVSIRQRYLRAVQMINDALVPVRAQGIQALRNVLRTDMENNSGIIDVDNALFLLMNLLKDPDSYVYMNSVGAISEIATISGPMGMKVLKTLVDAYIQHEVDNLDARLRIGEGLVQAIQRLDEAFVGQKSALVVQAVLSVVRDDSEDPRIRSSACGVLDVCLSTNSVALGNLTETVLDMSLHMLNMPNEREHSVVLRRGM